VTASALIYFWFIVQLKTHRVSSLYDFYQHSSKDIE
jgi:hypothetical protein